MNRLATGLAVLVGALSVVCIALIIVLVAQPPTQQEIQVSNILLLCQMLVSLHS